MTELSGNPKWVLSPLLGLSLSFLLFSKPIRGQTVAGMHRPKQFVLISFDGSYSIGMWQQTRQVAQRNGSKITYFMSGVHFLTSGGGADPLENTHRVYTPPRFNGRNRSLIGYGGSRDLLRQRILEVWRSYQAGMEIAGHANGHFDGSQWSEMDWVYEFDLFHQFVLEVFEIHRFNPAELGGLTADQWKQGLLSQLRSFRAPFLGRGEGLWRALSRNSWNLAGQIRPHRYLYDASQVARNTAAWPELTPWGFWALRMAVIPVPGLNKNVLSMDYNFYVAQSDNPNNPQPKPHMADIFENQMYQAYLRWFSQNYYGNRAPLNIGHHFSLWNNGAYWRALTRFMDTVCRLPEVECTSGLEFVRQVSGVSNSEYQAWAQGRFSREGVPTLNLPIVTPARARELPFPLVKDGFAILPNPKGSWLWFLPFQNEVISSEYLSLKELYQRGVTRVDLVNQGGKIYSFEIDGPWWQPELRPVYKNSEVLPCDHNSHQEFDDETIDI